MTGKSAELQKLKEFIENGGDEVISKANLDALPSKFYDLFILKGVKVDKLEPGRIVCSMTVPPRLLNSGAFLHGGATMSLVDLIGSAALIAAGKPPGVSIEISASYLDAAFAGEEIEIEATVLRAGNSIGFVTVEIRQKKTGKLIAKGRHTKYLTISSKM
ncbi:Thioesterase family protein [Zostera marina]|uniref:Acyl-coenzyme A thioesterase 13 n=1 Tax=Zostera marina TaxID=29655 RepID=A0A0K9PWM4_ZOSMR|nr:Thioesterase family protein [Zostera marina]